MTTEHTPGPYRVSYNPLPDDPPLVFIEARRGPAGTWVRLAEVLYVDAQSDATATLIAAAPALLDALEAICNETDEYDDPRAARIAWSTVVRARRIIAQARGEEVPT